MTRPRQYSGGANGNRSLQRCIEILRTFRPGVDTLGNGEIAERTGLARSTVSRLTKTLVNLGMLDEVRTQRNYRLSAAVLSFGHVVRMGSPVLKILGPLMRAESTRRRLNVGLATVDRAMTVYLESIRYSPRATLRSVVAGQQVPWRAEIVLLSADGLGTGEIMRRTGKSKTCVWRWQERFMQEGSRVCCAPPRAPHAFRRSARTLRPAWWHSRRPIRQERPRTGPLP